MTDMPSTDLYPWLRPTLETVLAGGRTTLPHALLVTGPAGIGKSRLADRLAAALLCEAPDAHGLACGRCLACNWYVQGSHPDFRRVEPLDEEAAERAGKGVRPSKDIRIQQIRALGDFMSLATHRGGSRVVLIDPGDALNTEAANALLKTLEEPTPHSHFIVVTSRWQRLPATIVSRCVRLSVAAPGPAEAGAWLARTAHLSEPVAAEWLAAAGGSPLHALALADPEQGAVHRLVLEALMRLPETAVANVAEVLSAQAAARWIEILQAWVTDLGRCALGSAPLRFAAQAERLGRLARQVRTDRLAAFAAWLDRQRAVADHPLNARLFCESVMMRYVAVFAT